MSFAYKLWRIGSVLNEDDIKSVIKIDATPESGKEPAFVNINFNLLYNAITSVNISKDSISKERMFFTKKLGGSGLGIYYMFPNLDVKLSTQDDSLFAKLPLLVNTLKYSVKKYSSESSQQVSNVLLKFFESRSSFVQMDPLKEFKTGNYWFWISVNNKTFWEIMPEIWLNWFNNPVAGSTEIKQGYDSFTNKETHVGFNPDVKIFSYDQYHDSLNYRMDKNLPLSMESAKYIRFAWVYILEKLFFFYKGLEYIIMPNMISQDKEAFRIVIEKLESANKKTASKPNLLKKLRGEEKKLKDGLEKLKKEKYKKRMTDLPDEAKKTEKEIQSISNQINENDTGFITEINEQIEQLGDLKDSVTLDFIFTSINRTNLSFEVKGSIEDVIPNRLSELVNIMAKDFLIEDNITLAQRDYNKTYLQDYFNRDELYFVVNKSQKNYKNSILQERLHLAKLLITEQTITMDDLMKRFAIHREVDYERKKRIKNGIKEWIDFPDKYTKSEDKLIRFFNRLNKVKE